MRRSISCRCSGGTAPQAARSARNWITLPGSGIPRAAAAGRALLQVTLGRPAVVKLGQLFVHPLNDDADFLDRRPQHEGSQSRAIALLFLEGRYRLLPCLDRRHEVFSLPGRVQFKISCLFSTPEQPSLIFPNGMPGNCNAYSRRNSSSESIRLGPRCNTRSIPFR